MTLIPIEHNNPRVLTTTQLAESFGTTTKVISNNFNRNKERYTEGKHFFSFEGESKREFIDRHQIEDSSKNAATLYLWTEKGAWMHAKSLNTDQAWDAYEMLVDDYYRVKGSIDLSQLSPELQMFKQIWDGLAKKEIEDARRDQEIKQLQSGIATIKDTFLQRDDDWRKSINKMLNTAAKELGGNYRELRAESYRVLEERGRCDLSARLRNLRQRLEDGGATKTKIRNTNKMDCIEADPRLKEIYTTIVKELSIGTLKI